MSTPLSALDATLSRLDGSSAFLKLNDGQEIRVSAALLPADIAVGAKVTLAVLTGPQSEAARAAMSRSVLNELLKE